MRSFETVRPEKGMRVRVCGNKIRTPEYRADDCFDSAIGGSAPFMTRVLSIFNNLRHISLSVENLHFFHELIIFSSSRWC